MRRAIACLMLLGAACRDFDVLSRCFDGGCGPRADPCWKTASRAYRDEVLADEPLVYLRLGEVRSGDAGVVAVDELGRFSGTYVSDGVTYGVPGAISRDPDTAVRLDGAQRAGVRVEPALDLGPTAPFTVEAWVDPIDQRNFGMLVDHEDFSGGREGWVLRAGQDKVAFERRGRPGEPADTVSTDAPLPLDAGFHAVVATYDGRELFLYVDGVAKAGRSTTLPSQPVITEWWIGIAAPRNNGIFGAVDEVAVYSHALEACRVSAHEAAAR